MFAINNLICSPARSSRNKLMLRSRLHSFVLVGMAITSIFLALNNVVPTLIKKRKISGKLLLRLFSCQSFFFFYFYLSLRFSKHGLPPVLLLPYAGRITKEKANHKPFSIF